MSTKTAFKRVALVAAAALAIGGISAVSANAIASAPTAAVTTLGTPVRSGVNTFTIPVTITQTVTGAVAGETITAALTGSASPQASGKRAKMAIALTGTSTAPDSTHESITGTITVTATSNGTDSLTGTPSTNRSDIALLPGSYSIVVVSQVASLAATTAPAVVAVIPATNFGASGTFGALGEVASSGSGGALVQAVNGQATLDFIAGSADTSYTVTTSGVGSMLATTPSSGAVSYLNGTTAAAGFTWTPVATALTDLLVTTTSAVAGIQTISFQPIGTNGAPGIPVLATITWGGGVTFSPTSTVVRQGSAVPAKVVAGDGQEATSATVLNYTSALDAIPQSAVKTAGTAGSVIEVVTLNSDGSAALEGNTVSATITGSGLITASTTAPTPATALTVTGSARTSNVVLDGSHNVAWIYVNADGTAGTGTVTVSVTDAITGVTTVVGSKVVTFYGSVAKLTASVNYSIGRAGYTTGAAATHLDGVNSISSPLAAGTTVPAFTITATDSNGNPVTTAAVPSVSSSDMTVVTGGACALDDGSVSTASSSTNGVGVYNCSFTSAPNAVSGAKATLTIKVLNPADATGTTYITTTIPVTIGGAVAKTVLTTDAASYQPGAQMLVTFTATDAKGNPVYDGAASPGSVSANLATGGSAAFNSWYTGGVDASAASLAKSKLYAPSIAGDLVLTATGTDAASTVLTANATVSGGVTDTAASAATDAANEATDAANAATDAANAAADAADAATSAAQDAGAKADAALAAVTALSAKITVLAAQIAKIVKKLKA